MSRPTIEEQEVPAQVMTRAQARRRRQHGRKGQGPAEDTILVLRRKMIKDRNTTASTTDTGDRVAKAIGDSLHQAEVASEFEPELLRRLSVRFKSKSPTLADYDNPNLNPGLEDLWPPSSESESSSEPESDGDEDSASGEACDGQSGLRGRLTKANNPASWFSNQLERLPEKRIRKQKEKRDLVEELRRDPRTSDLLGIKSWIKVLEDRETNLKRVKAGHEHHLARAMDTWQAQIPTASLGKMQGLEPNAPTLSKLERRMAEIIRRRDDTEQKLKLVRDDRDRAERKATSLRKYATLASGRDMDAGLSKMAAQARARKNEQDHKFGETAVSNTAVVPEAVQFAGWAYRQARAEGAAVDSTGGEDRVVEYPDLGSFDAVVSNTASGQEQNGNADDREEAPPTWPQGLSESWYTGGLSEHTRPPPVSVPRRPEIVSGLAEKRSALPFPRAKGPELRASPSSGKSNSSFHTSRNDNSSHTNIRLQISSRTVSSVSQLEREKVLRREQESNSRKRKWEIDNRSADSGRRLNIRTGPGVTSVAGKPLFEYDDGMSAKKRKLQQEMEAYHERELKKIRNESMAWESGVLSWVAFKTRQLLE